MCGKTKEDGVDGDRVLGFRVVRVSFGDDGLRVDVEASVHLLHDTCELERGFLLERIQHWLGVK